MTKANDVRNQITKLREELSKLENENIFISPKVKLPKSIESAIAWLCIAKGYDICVAGERHYIAYTFDNECFFCDILFNDSDVETGVFNFGVGVDYMEFFSNKSLEKFCCRFSPGKNDTYTVTFLKVEMDDVGNINIEDID